LIKYSVVGVSEIGTMGLRPEEGLSWRCPAKTENYRPAFSSERAPHINKSINVKK
jgi:hypothetical protein